MIRPDDTVVIRIARSEMGQGTLTGLAQLVAEELECDWSKVTTEFPTPGENAARKRVWGNFSTGGSRGIRESHEYVRKGGAAARDMLIRAAAAEWGVPPGECSAANSVITHKPSGRTTSYGKVAEAAAKLDPPSEVKLKDPKDWKIAGKPLKRLDTPDKVNGKTGLRHRSQDAGDADRDDPRLPGARRQAQELRRRQGREDARRQEGRRRSATAPSRSSPTVSGTPRPRSRRCRSSGTRGRTPRSAAPTSPRCCRRGSTPKDAFVGHKAGDAEAALAGAAKVVEAVYSYPVPEPRDDGADERDRALHARQMRGLVPDAERRGDAGRGGRSAAGLPVAKCDVYKTLLGGGFGRRGAGQDYARQAVLIAKQMPGTPVKLIWTREEDMTHDFYHPITQCKLRGGLDASGNLVGLHMRISGQSILRRAVAAER